jgi:hypothetical protein
MYTLKGKTRQTHHVRFPRQSTYARCTLSRVIDRVEQDHCSQEEGLPTQSTARRWPISGSVPSFSPERVNEAVGAKVSIYQRSATRLTGPISPVCDRYVQYLLAGANWTILNGHKRGLQPLRWRLSTYHSPTFPTSCLSFPLVSPPGLHITKLQQLNYCSLHLRLAITNDLSLAMRSQG